MVNESIFRLFGLHQHHGWVLWIVLTAAIFLSSCSETQAPVVSSAELQETKIVVRDEGPAKWHYFDYKLPRAGSATLRLLNGARTNAPTNTGSE